ncbi:MAG: hypothetical protein GPJ18_07135 [Microcystis aeruginosa F13-15]|nr:hypothetical protein [Microcystis aeruginosa F13-15]
MRIADDQVQDITEYDYRNIMGGCGEGKVEIKTEKKPDGTTVVTITIT